MTTASHGARWRRNTYSTQLTHQVLLNESLRLQTHATMLGATRPAGDRERQDAEQACSAVTGLLYSWRDGNEAGRRRAQWFFVSRADERYDGRLTSDDYDCFWDPALLSDEDRFEAEALWREQRITLRPYHEAAFGTCAKCGMPTRRVGRYACDLSVEAHCQRIREIGNLCLRCPRVTLLGNGYRGINTY